MSSLGSATKIIVIIDRKHKRKISYCCYGSSSADRSLIPRPDRAGYELLFAFLTQLPSSHARTGRTSLVS